MLIILKNPKQKKDWLVLETETLVIVYPDHDTEPHGRRVNDKTYDLDTALCTCNPRVTSAAKYDLGDGVQVVTYDRPLVVHNAFDGRH